MTRHQGSRGPRFPNIQSVLDHYHIAYDPSKRGEQFIYCPNPAHKDEHPTNCSLNLTKQVFKCFVCDAEGGIGTLIWLIDGASSIASTPPKPQSRTQAKPAKRASLQGCTLAQLAQAKGLDAVWLNRSLGWRDGSWFGTPAVIIPYCDSKGTPLPHRYRVGLDSGTRFLWEKGAKPTLYGLLNWSRMDRTQPLILSEGETNTASLLYNNYLALGIPGASNYNHAWDTPLKDFKWLYLWQDPDAAGEKLAADRKAALPNLRIIKAPPGVKDPNELLQQCDGQFQVEFEKLLDLADAEDLALRSLISVPEKMTPPSTEISERKAVTSQKAVISQKAVTPQHWPKGQPAEPATLLMDRSKNPRWLLNAQERQGRVSELLIDNYNQRGMPMASCGQNYKVRICLHGNIPIVAPLHCNEPFCAMCIEQQLGRWFQSKESYLRQLADPVTYGVFLPVQTLTGRMDDKMIQVRNSYDDIRTNIKRLYHSDSEKALVAQDAADALRRILTGDQLEWAIGFLTDYDPANLDLLREQFPGAQVKIVSWHMGLRHAIDALIDHSDCYSDFDTYENFRIITETMKGAKLIQGHGKLYKVTGGRHLNKEEDTREGGCPWCGSDECRKQPGWIIPVKGAPPTKFEESPLTGRKSLTFAEPWTPPPEHPPPEHPPPEHPRRHH